MVEKGIVLAGGRGSRLAPLTAAVSKQLLPVYDKPLVYYPLSVLMLAGIRQVLLISTPEDVGRFGELLGDGRRLGLSLSYTVQPQPQGIAQALLLGAAFIEEDPVALMLGDNLFYGQGLQELLTRVAVRQQEPESGATIFAYPVRDPQSYGVVELEQDPYAPGVLTESPLGRATHTAFQARSLEEKPQDPKSSYAVTGLYFYDRHAVEIARQLTPSDRGELEITDVNREYLRRGNLTVEVLSRGFAWFDAGTPDALLQAAQFVQTLQQRQGLMIACLEEIAFRKGLIDLATLRRAADDYPNDYGRYLAELVSQNDRLAAT